MIENLFSEHLVATRIKKELKIITRTLKVGENQPEKTISESNFWQKYQKKLKGLKQKNL